MKVAVEKNSPSVTVHIYSDQWPNGCHNCEKDVLQFVDTKCGLVEVPQPPNQPYYLVQETPYYNIYSETKKSTQWECITTQLHNAYINEQPMRSKGPYGYIVGLSVIGVIVLVLLILVLLNYWRQYRHRIQNQVPEYQAV